MGVRPINAHFFKPKSKQTKSNETKKLPTLKDLYNLIGCNNCNNWNDYYLPITHTINQFKSV